MEKTCTRCGRSIPQAEAAYCPFCGAPLAAPAAALPQGAEALLAKAARQQNNKKKLQLLREAREQYPDCLPVEEEWLFQQKLPTNARDALDFSRIKCHLLHLYLTPEAFTPEEAAAMRFELFEDPQLLRCLRLAADEQSWLAKYLLRLSREFIQVFLMGSSEYMPRLMGFRLERDAARALAKPAAQMLRAMAADEALPQPRRALLQTAFEQAFSAECGGSMHWLRQALEA